MTRHDAAATQGRQHRTDRDHGDARVRDRHAAGPGARAARGRALAGVDPEAAVRGGLAEVERDLHVVRVQLARLRDAVDPAGARDLA
ncbi:MAG: hypothetical protein KC464_12780, partial [Myxococcales bacterium]|nr:hypothetical protein [Myxococcales bacterium]